MFKDGMAVLIDKIWTVPFTTYISGGRSALKRSLTPGKLRPRFLSIVTWH